MDLYQVMRWDKIILFGDLHEIFRIVVITSTNIHNIDPSFWATGAGFIHVCLWKIDNEGNKIMNLLYHWKRKMVWYSGRSYLFKECPYRKFWLDHVPVCGRVSSVDTNIVLDLLSDLRSLYS